MWTNLRAWTRFLSWLQTVRREVAQRVGRRRTAEVRSRRRPLQRHTLGLEPLQPRLALTVTVGYDAPTNALTLTGDGANDTITVTSVSGNLNVIHNGTTVTTFNGVSVAASAVQSINVSGGSGNDLIDLAKVNNAFHSFSAANLDNDVTLAGGHGTDRIIGSEFKDEITGDAGVDTLQGNGGNDTIGGGNDGDHLIGGNAFNAETVINDLVSPSGRTLGEASGAVVSQQHGLIWTIQDGGNGAYLFANNKGGTSLGYYALTGSGFTVTNGDWEALSAYRHVNPSSGATTNYLYVGDIGDSNKSGTDQRLTIYRFVEPTTTPATNGQHTPDISVTQRIVVDFTDSGHRDAEAMFVDPTDGAIYIITKTEGSYTTSQLYKIDAPSDSDWNSGVEKDVSSAASTPFVDSGDTEVADAAISNDGRELLIQTDTQIHYYHRPSLTTTIASLVAGTSDLLPEEFATGVGGNGWEGIAWDETAAGFYTISDGSGTANFPMNYYERTTTAGQNNDSLSGNAGNDILYGGIGADNLYGDDGDDQIYGGIDNDLAYGGFGNDSIYGESGNDHLIGGFNTGTATTDGNDAYFGGTGSDEYDWYGVNGGVDTAEETGVGVDTDRLYFAGVTTGITFNMASNSAQTIGNGTVQLLTVTTGFERIDGTAFADTLTGNANNNYLSGAGGNDKLYGEDGDDQIYGGIDNDLAYGGFGNDSIYGESGNDHLIGGFNTGTATTDGNDAYFGGTGSDEYDWYGVNGGVDTAEETGVGVDTDRLYFAGVTTGITFNMASNSAQTIGNGTVQLLTVTTGFERIDGTAFADTLTGNANNNYLSGAGGNDKLYGEDGDDQIYGGIDNDLAYGGFGNDSIYGESGNDHLIGGFNTGTATTDGNDAYFGGTGSDEYDWYGVNGGVDTAEETGVGVDTDRLYFAGVTTGITFNMASNSAQTIGNGTVQLLTVTTGFERIDGTAFADTLTGNANNNYLSGAGGNDKLYGEDGDDQIYGGIDNDLAYGGFGNDSIYGESGNDHLIGGFNTGTATTDGNDAYFGGTGSDEYDWYGVNGGVDTAEETGVGVDTDRLYFAGVTTGITFNMASNSAQTIGNGTVQLLTVTTGFERIDGTAFADTLTGNANNNYLSGAGGNDTLYGGAGNDTVDGGSGTDTGFGGGDPNDTQTGVEIWTP